MASVASAATAASAAAIRFRTSFIHVDGASANLATVERGDGFVSIVIVHHFDEPEAPRTSGIPVGENADPLDLTVALEQLPQFVFVGVEAEIPHENILHASPLH